MVIRNNRHKYPIAAMCKVLNISRSGYYKYKDPVKSKDIYTDLVIKVFNQNYQCYGTRRIKKVLELSNIFVSRRRIARIMREEGLISSYTVQKFIPEKTVVNQDPIPNKIARDFDNRDLHEVIVSDLTYVKVGNKWNYVCTIIDLYNREILASSCGPEKSAELVKKTFSKIKVNLSKFKYFHTDRGSEFNNKIIEEILTLFGIKRSLSKAGSPYDNAVAESTFKSIKTELINPRVFRNILELENALAGYTWWFNNKRLHSSLNYKSPIQWKRQTI